MDASTLAVKMLEWERHSAQQTLRARIEAAVLEGQDADGRQRASNVQRRTKVPMTMGRSQGWNGKQRSSRAETWWNVRTKTPKVEKIDWKAVCDTMRVTMDEIPVKSGRAVGHAQAAGVGRPNTRGRKTMTTKPYQTTVEPTHHDRAHHRPVLEFVAVWMLAAVCAILGIAGGGSAEHGTVNPAGAPGADALGIVALLFLAAAVSCAAYARLEHGVAYGAGSRRSRPLAKRRVVHPRRGDPEGQRRRRRFKQNRRRF